MDKAILHVDMNNFFASVELLTHPELSDLPVIVCGDEHSRRGVVLAKNMLAKSCAIETAETVFSARQKCPNLICLPAHFEKYKYYSELARNIYEGYTPYVESFGLDECWLEFDDLNQAEKAAKAIRQEVKQTLGLTVSIGVSFTKVFAKLASDYKKPDAITLISKDNYQTLVWPLPISALLYVGKVTAEKLGKIGIHTIGQLASTDKAFLGRFLGKMGRQLWEEAHGIENDKVALAAEKRQAKSIGNSMTLARDATSIGEIRAGFHCLAQSVATRLETKDRFAETVQIMVKDWTFKSQTRQTKLEQATGDHRILFDHAVRLFEINFDLNTPIRSLGLTAMDLISVDDSMQLSFEDLDRQQSKSTIKDTVNNLKKRFGNIIDIGVTDCDRMTKVDD